MEAGFGVPANLPDHVAAVAARHRVVLLTREGCHLCEDADEIVRQVVGPAEYAHVAIDGDPETRDLFATDIPVVIVDGRLLARWRVSADELTQALEERQ